MRGQDRGDVRRRLVGRDDADVVYSQWRDNRFSVYVRYSEKGSATLTNAWKKWLDKFPRQL